MVSDLLAAVVRVVRFWRDTAERKMPKDELGSLSHESYAFWMTRIDRQERNGTLRRD